MGRNTKSLTDKVVNLQAYPRQWMLDLLGRSEAASIATKAIEKAANKAKVEQEIQTLAEMTKRKK